MEKRHKKRDPNRSINVRCPCTVSPIQSNAFIQDIFVPDSVHCPVCLIFIESLAHRTIANLKPDSLQLQASKKRQQKQKRKRKKIMWPKVIQRLNNYIINDSITIIDIERIY